jgi:hypothetical protein
MKIYSLLSAVAISLCLASVAPATDQPPPKAKGWQSSFTKPGTGLPSNIQITKASKIKIKPSSNNLTFSLKLAGVTNKADDTPVTNVMNTLKVDVQVGALSTTLNFPFGITNGKNVEKTFSVSNGMLPNAPTAGDAVQILDAFVVEAGTGRTFGVTGITLK